MWSNQKVTFPHSWAEKQIRSKRQSSPWILTLRWVWGGLWECVSVALSGCGREWVRETKRKREREKKHFCSQTAKACSICQTPIVPKGRRPMMVTFCLKARRQSRIYNEVDPIHLPLFLFTVHMIVKCFKYNLHIVNKLIVRTGSKTISRLVFGGKTDLGLNKALGGNWLTACSTIHCVFIRQKGMFS